MDNQSQINTGRKRDEYDSISTDTRRALVQLVFQHNVSIRRASIYLGIKYSTGKTLVQQYRRTGNIDRVKKQRAPKNAQNGIHLGKHNPEDSDEDDMQASAALVSRALLVNKFGDNASFSAHGSANPRLPVPSSI